MDFLKNFRKTKNLTQAELATIMQLDQSAYSRLENSDTILSIKNALKLAKHFGISLDEIYGIKKSDSSETELPEIVSIYNQLTEQGKAELLNFAKFKLSEQNG